MSGTEFGTVNGQPITPEMLTGFSRKFERDWQDSEVVVKPTGYGKALDALQSLELRAQGIHEPLPRYLRSVLQKELVSVYGVHPSTVYPICPVVFTRR
jgi:hypothetical protein